MMFPLVNLQYAREVTSATPRRATLHVVRMQKYTCWCKTALLRFYGLCIRGIFKQGLYFGTVCYNIIMPLRLCISRARCSCL